MKGYIKRLSQDIEKLEFKRDRLANFLTDPREEIDDEQTRLLNEQSALMGQLVEVMEQRLEYERKIHPDYFEDLPEEVDDADDCDEQETVEE